MSRELLSDDECAALIDYARRKYAEERWPLSPSLLVVRKALEKLTPKPPPKIMPPGKPYVPSQYAQRQKRRW
jgi:hypothetical protein